MTANLPERQRWNDRRWTEHWPKRERFTDMVTPVLIKALSLQPGEHVLDVGCGGGNMALRVAEIVGTGGVVGADISLPLTELARQRAVETGATNVSFQTVDVQTDRIENGPFDVAMSQFGVMFFDDPHQGFGNVRAHLRDGGRLGFACWQAADKNPWFFASTLVDIVPTPRPREAGKSPTGPFSLADGAHVQAILHEAGFVAVSLETHEISVEVPEDAVVDDAQLIFLGVPDEKMKDARMVVDRHMAQFRLSPELSRFTLAYQIVTALVPGT